MVQAAQRELIAAGAQTPDTVIADAGYWRNRDVQHAQLAAAFRPVSAHGKSRVLLMGARSETRR